MFTGIVEGCSAVRSWERRGAGGRLVLPAPARTLDEPWSVRPGESVSVSGVCLTVAELLASAGGTGADMAFDLTGETLLRTWFDELAPGRMLNLERALRLGDRLGGHLVSGHVDGIGRIAAARNGDDGGREVEVDVADGLERYLIEKGSVTVDGISLTVVRPLGRRFCVALIPATLGLTSLGGARVGQRVNLEADLVGKWIERLVPAHAARVGGA